MNLLNALYDIEIELIATAVVAIAGGLYLTFFLGPIKTAATNTIALLCKNLVRDLRGKWTATVSLDSETYTQKLEIAQRISSVWGVIECDKQRCKYKFKGKLVHDTLLGEFELAEDDGMQVSRGAFILVLGGDFVSMAGVLVAHRNSELRKAEYTLRRVA